MANKKPKSARTAQLKKDWSAKVLEAIAVGATVTEAAKVAGVGRRTVYDRLESDSAFKVAFDDAIEQGTDAIEGAATFRAIHGVEEPVIYQGQLTYLYERNKDGTIKTREVNYTDAQGNTTTKVEPILLLDEKGNPRVLTVRKPSDTLAIFLLKGRRPQKFRDNVDLTSGGQPLYKVLKGVSQDDL